MIFVLISCLAPNLAGDSVYPNTPTCSDMLGDVAEADVEDMGEVSYQLYDLMIIPSEPEVEGSIEVVVEEYLIDVAHSSVALSCDMSAYQPEIIVDGFSISVFYMPLEEERDCFYNVAFSLDRPFDSGNYTLTLMEDSTEFFNE